MIYNCFGKYRIEINDPELLKNAGLIYGKSITNEKDDTKLIVIEKVGNHIYYFLNEHLIYQANCQNWILKSVQLIEAVLKDQEPDKFIMIHGSCVQMYGRIFIFTGNSGGGKSTLIYNLITNYNAYYVCDDIVLYDKFSKRLVTIPNKTMHLRYDTNNGDCYCVSSDINSPMYIVPVKSKQTFNKKNCELKDIVLVDLEYKKNTITEIKELSAYGSILKLIHRTMNISDLKKSDLIKFFSKISHYYTCIYSGEIIDVIKFMSMHEIAN
ncbi:MAG: hypothetical protein GX638_08175 [Crenarchaeota archaeon]|nr:hypothetical protein [Thermoproteota archaeon]